VNLWPLRDSLRWSELAAAGGVQNDHHAGLHGSVCESGVPPERELDAGRNGRLRSVSVVRRDPAPCSAAAHAPVQVASENSGAASAHAAPLAARRRRFAQQTRQKRKGRKRSLEPFWLFWPSHIIRRQLRGAANQGHPWCIRRSKSLRSRPVGSFPTSKGVRGSLQTASHRVLSMFPEPVRGRERAASPIRDAGLRLEVNSAAPGRLLLWFATKENDFPQDALESSRSEFTSLAASVAGDCDGRGTPVVP